MVLSAETSFIVDVNCTATMSVVVSRGSADEGTNAVGRLSPEVRLVRIVREGFHKKPQASRSRHLGSAGMVLAFPFPAIMFAFLV
jgi:hypothetical protein